MKKELKPIIFVDDSPLDVELTMIALRRGGVRNDIIVIRDGDKALDHFELVAHEKEPCPALVLLDINMVKMDGIEILKHLREQPTLRKVPVIMLTGSAEPSDPKACADYQASAYFVKPMDVPTFLEAARPWLEP